MTKPPETTNIEEHEISVDAYKAFLNTVTPDRKCYVCGNDRFTILSNPKGVCAIFMMPHNAAGTLMPSGTYFSLGHHCNKCGTVTLTAYHLVKPE